MTPDADAALRPHGLRVTGRFEPGPEDGAPEGTAALLLIGAAGGAMWHAFAASPEAGDGRPDPLDRWSARVIGRAARDLGGRAVFPFEGPPWPPFLAWGRRAEGARPSPVGMLVSPGRGLWTSWRGAIALTHAPEEDAAALPDPCLGCPAPCLTACPVAALGAGGYDVPACTAHVASAAGSECRESGCRARQACPAGAGAAPPAAQRAFHMAAFLRAHPPGATLSD